MKQIRVYINNTFLIILSVMVMAGATGLSYKAHYCHGNLSGLAFFTEIGNRQSISCGCTADNSAQPVSASPVFKKYNCCSNISFFSKLNIESPVNYFSSISLVQPAVMAIIPVNTLQPAVQKESLSIHGFRAPPSPPAGRKLVLFLSQQRIPLISYIG